jgi:nitroreductase
VKGPKHATIADWTARQAYIALGQLMTSAATLGVDTTPMEGLDPAAFDRLLGLEGSGYTTAVACAVGYRAADDAYAALPKVRFATDELVVNL